MLAASGHLQQLVRDFTADEAFSDITFTLAYENDIKPYPVDKPIVAFTTDKTTIGEQLTIYNQDGSQVLSKNRIADTVIKASIFVPYESGALTCFEIFDRVFTKLLFSSSMKIVSSHCYNSSYVRDCGALVLTADFTIRSTEKS